MHFTNIDLAFCKPNFAVGGKFLNSESLAQDISSVISVTNEAFVHYLTSEFFHYFAADLDFKDRVRGIQIGIIDQLTLMNDALHNNEADFNKSQCSVHLSQAIQTWAGSAECIRLVSDAFDLLLIDGIDSALDRVSLENILGVKIALLEIIRQISEEFMECLVPHSTWIEM